VLVIALLVLLSGFHFVRGAQGARAYGFVDFPIFLAQARLFVMTGELYADPGSPELYAPSAAVYKFPPLYAAMLVPLVRHGIPESLYIGHWLLQLILYAGAVLTTLAWLGRGRGATFWVGGAVLAANFEPFFETLWRLQIETPLLLLLTLALVAYTGRRQAWTGAALGAAAMLKVYPLFLLLYFGVRRNWRVLIGTVAAVAGLLAVSVLVIGIRENATYYLKILPLLLAEAPQASSENLSWARFLELGMGLAPGVAKRVGQALVLPLIGVSVVAVWPRRTEANSRLRRATQFGLFVPLMLLVMPNSWVNYQLLLLLPILVLLVHCVTPGRDRWGLSLVLAAAYLPTMFYWPCAAPSVPWPCAQTPLFLGLARLPRLLHDLMVELRAITPLLLWAGLYTALRSETADDGSAPSHRPESKPADAVG
jgi:hypothetical protein